MQYDFNNLKEHEKKVCDHSECREYSVLIPIIKKEGKESILFEVRSHELVRQPSEICFPGGKIEHEETRLQAAVRESCEELLIDEGCIKVLGEIDTLVTPFNTVIYPFTAKLEGYNGTFSRQEVEEVFAVPIDFLMHHDPICSYLDVQMAPREDFPFEKIQYGRQYPWARGKYPVYIYEYEGKVIWGITARVLRNFIEIIKSK